jgi:excisionase family DNA binding protein
MIYAHLKEQKSNLGQKREQQGMKEILTPSQVAALLQIHVKTVYRLTMEGVIPGNRIGRSWRFRKSNILDLLSNKQGKRSSLGKTLGLRRRSHHS